MAGAGVVKAEYNGAEFQAILDALSKASMPDLKSIADFAGGELDRISKKAFENEADPVSGAKWAELKYPRANGSKRPILNAGGQLKRSLGWEAFPDGSVIYGTPMIYSLIHLEGGKTKAHEITPSHAKALHFNGQFAKRVKHPGSLIPARPYMGVPQDFDRRILTDPAILDLLGMAGGAP